MEGGLCRFLNYLVLHAIATTHHFLNVIQFTFTLVDEQMLLIVAFILIFIKFLKHKLTHLVITNPKI